MIVQTSACHVTPPILRCLMSTIIGSEFPLVVHSWQRNISASYSDYFRIPMIQGFLIEDAIGKRSQEVRESQSE
jgi:hypothetical protein